MIKEKLVKDLLELPLRISNEKKDLLILMNDLEIKEAFIKTWEVVESNKINNEVDKEGKLIYSSDVKRKAELEKRKLENEDYKNLLNEINDYKMKIEFKKIYIERLVNEQKNLRALCLIEGDDAIE